MPAPKLNERASQSAGKSGFTVHVMLPTAIVPPDAKVRQNDTVVVSVTSRGSPTATIRLLLLDG